MPNPSHKTLVLWRPDADLERGHAASPGWEEGRAGARLGGTLSAVLSKWELHNLLVLVG